MHPMDTGSRGLKIGRQRHAALPICLSFITIYFIFSLFLPEVNYVFVTIFSAKERFERLRAGAASAPSNSVEEVLDDIP